MRIHFIAIGGSAMHNLALALHDEGHEITGSDDEIYEPSRSRLLEAGLLPAQSGWYTEKIVPNLDAVILGMHAKKDNPELIRALALNIPVFSYPEFVFNQSKNKRRIVIAGSHGKTTTTSIIMHVLRNKDMDFDYLVGAGIEGFDRMVRLSEAPFIVIEGDEYLSSPIDRIPKMLHYKPHVAVITGIAWDHINVFPTFEEYKKQFRYLVESMPEDGHLIYYEKDEHVNEIVRNISDATEMTLAPYDEITLDDGIKRVGDKAFRVHLIGSHNRQNIEAAWRICRELGIAENDFYKALESFTGARKRLQQIYTSSDKKVYLDFAHAPSKVAATTRAMKEAYPDKPFLAVLELHTFSSLNKDFIPEYKNALDAADEAIVYVDAHTIQMKGMETLEPSMLKKSFNHSSLTIHTNKESLQSALEFFFENSDAHILLMSSGNFGSLDLGFLKNR